MKFIKEFKDTFAISGVATFFIGVLLLIYPGFTGKALCYLLAAVLITKGVFGIISRYRNKNLPSPVAFELIGNFMTALMGVFVATRSEFIISIIPFIFGMFLLMSGLTSLQKTIMLKRMEYPQWKTGVVFIVIKLVLAAIILMNPFSTALTLTRFIGACLIYDGASGLVTFYETVKAKNDYEKAQDELRSLNLTRDEEDEEDLENIPVVEAEFVDVVEETIDADDEN